MTGIATVGFAGGEDASTERQRTATAGRMEDPQAIDLILRSRFHSLIEPRLTGLERRLALKFLWGDSRRPAEGDAERIFASKACDRSDGLDWQILFRQQSFGEFDPRFPDE